MFCFYFFKIYLLIWKSYREKNRKREKQKERKRERECAGPLPPKAIMTSTGPGPPGPTSPAAGVHLPFTTRDTSYTRGMGNGGNGGELATPAASWALGTTPSSVSRTNTCSSPGFQVQSPLGLRDTPYPAYPRFTGVCFQHLPLLLVLKPKPWSHLFWKL